MALRSPGETFGSGWKKRKQFFLDDQDVKAASMKQRQQATPVPGKHIRPTPAAFVERAHVIVGKQWLHRDLDALCAEIRQILQIPHTGARTQHSVAGQSKTRMRSGMADVLGTDVTCNYVGIGYLPFYLTP